VRVGRIRDTWILNPTFQQLEYSEVDIVVAGSEDAIIMVEGGAVEVAEEQILEALQVGHTGIRELIGIQKELLRDHIVPNMTWTPVEPNAALKSRVEDLARDRVEEALNLADKQ